MANLIIELFGFFIIGMLSLLIHEAGHITAARLSNARNIQLKIGAGKSLFGLNIGRLHIKIHRLLFLQFATSSEACKQYTRLEKIFISFMGPIYSILFAAFCYMMFAVFRDAHGLYFGFLFNVWIGIVNLLPFKIGQKTSDGYVIIKLLIR